MAVFINKNVVWFDVPVYTISRYADPPVLGGAPMNKAELVDCFDRKHALGHVEACDILRESVVLDEHGHQVAAR